MKKRGLLATFLLLLVAFGESVVAIGIGLAGVELEARMYVAAVLGLLLVSALWWTYFAGDDERRAIRSSGYTRRLPDACVAPNPSPRTCRACAAR